MNREEFEEAVKKLREMQTPEENAEWDRRCRALLEAETLKAFDYPNATEEEKQLAREFEKLMGAPRGSIKGGMPEPGAMP